MATATVTISVPSAEVRANDKLLGGNVSWTNNGDTLLTANTLNFNPTTNPAVLQIKPTSVRSPGGNNADAYRWAEGLGNFEERGVCATGASASTSKVDWGTHEFMNFCVTQGAEAIVQLNLVSADAAEARAWLAYVRSTVEGKGQPSNVWWELGNEPYLNAAAHLTNLTPAEFAARWLAYAAELEAELPGVQLGVPLRMDASPNLPAVPWVHKTGYNATMLAALVAARKVPQFWSVHPAYWPDISSTLPSDAVVLGSISASSEMVRRAIVEQRVQLSAYASAPGMTGLDDLPLMVTEWSLFASIDLTLTRTLAAAVYAVDAVRIFAQEGIFSSQYWSLANNGSFGTVSGGGVRRPVFWALRWLRQVLQGRMLTLSVAADTAASADDPGTPGRCGRVPTGTQYRFVEGMASIQGARLRVILINKSISESEDITINLPMRAVRGRAFSIVAATAPLDRTDNETKTTVAAATLGAGSSFVRTLPSYSISYLEFWLS